MNEREMARLNAEMEGNAAVVRTIGGKRKIGEMELIVLINLAHLACLTEFVTMADEDLVQEVEAARDEFAAAVRSQFARGQEDGLYRLMVSCTAMLGSERFAPYLVRTGE
jgi:hypothetical protein